MVTYTDDYNLAKLGPGDSLATDNYKFGTTDRELIAQLLRLGAETHHHNGQVAGDSGLEVGARSLTLTHSQDSGVIPGGVRVHYQFTIVVDGVESNPSDAVYFDTPSPVASPLAPTLSTVPTGGVLLPGNYYYVLTAYTGTNTQETRGPSPKYILVPQGTSTNVVTVTLPAVPVGADGFNIYRKKPGGVRYDYVASLDMGVATPPTTFIDDGTIEEDCNRTLPSQNYTNIQNKITVDLTGTALPAGARWRLYRTYVDGDYLNSRIADLPDDELEFEDLGAPGVGSPPTEGVSVGSPERILLTNADEVQGSLPPGMVSGFPIERSFFFPGVLSPGVAESIWVCPFEEAYVVGAIGTLGRNSFPASLPVIFDVQVGSGSAPTFASVYTTPEQRPSIATTATVGEWAAATVAIDDRRLERGDSLSTEIIQTGGGATPTDEDLTISIVLEVKYGDALLTTVWTP